MTILYIVISMIILGFFNYFTSKLSDQRTMIQLQEFLIVGSKENPCVSMHRIMGYGGGWAEFVNKSFSFMTDEGLFTADRIISSSPPFKVVFREQQ